MKIFKITTRIRSEVAKTFVVQAYDEEDAINLSERLLLGHEETIMNSREVPDELHPKGETMQEYVDKESSVEFLFATGGSTPSVVWPRGTTEYINNN